MGHSLKFDKMKINIGVLTVALVACLVPAAQGIFIPDLATLAAAKGAVIKAGVSALATKGAMIGGAVLGAKAGAHAAIKPPPPPIVVNKPAHGIFMKPVDVHVPTIPSVMDKVSGFWNILRGVINGKTELVSNVVTALTGPTVVEEPKVYEIIDRPKFYRVPVIQKYEYEIEDPRLPYCDDKK